MTGKGLLSICKDKNKPNFTAQNTNPRLKEFRLNSIYMTISFQPIKNFSLNSRLEAWFAWIFPKIEATASYRIYPSIAVAIRITVCPQTVRLGDVCKTDFFALWTIDALDMTDAEIGYNSTKTIMLQIDLINFVYSMGFDEYIILVLKSNRSMVNRKLVNRWVRALYQN